jgi:hypothetical protein
MSVLPELEELRIPVSPIDDEQAFDIEPPPLDFVLPGILVGTVTVGEGAFDGMQVAVCVASGVDRSNLFDGDNVAIKQGRAAYLSLTEGADILRHRLWNIVTTFQQGGKQLTGKERAEIASRLDVYSLNGHSYPLTINLDKLEGVRLLVIDATDSKMAACGLDLDSISHEVGCAVIRTRGNVPFLRGGEK